MGGGPGPLPGTSAHRPLACLLLGGRRLSSLGSLSSCLPHCHVSLDSCHVRSETCPFPPTWFWKGPWTGARKPSSVLSLCPTQPGDLGHPLPWRVSDTPLSCPLGEEPWES